MASYHLVNRIINELLIEADVSRRSFLKTSGAAVASTLLNFGIPVPVVKSALAQLSGSARPMEMIISLSSWDAYRGEFADLAAESSKLARVFSFFRKLGVPVRSYTDDEYSYGVELSVEALEKLKDHISWHPDGGGTLKIGKLGLDFFGSEPGFAASGSTLNGGIVNNPAVDFWNHYAKYDARNAVANREFVDKLRHQYGELLDKPEIETITGTKRIDWDELGKDEYDDEYDEYEDEEEYDEEHEEPRPYDDYDEYQQSTWSAEGGFTESIQELYKRVRNQTITLIEALQWTKDLNWPEAEQQKLAMDYIRRTISE